MKDEKIHDGLLFNRIFQNLKDFAVFTLDTDGNISSWNEGARKVFGFEEDEILGRHLSTIFPSADLEQANWELAEARKTGHADEERWHQRKSKDRFWASGILRAVHDADGNLTGFVKILCDLTDRKTAEEQRDRLLRQLQEAAQLKDRFLAILSHELRTPLAAILGWSSLLYKGQLKGKQLKPAIESIYRNANTQAGLIQDLLDMSRIAAGQLKIEAGTVDVSRVLQDALDSVRFMAATKRIDIQSEVDETIRPIRGDARRVQQILWNLLSNAIKFTPTAGRVSVTARLGEENIEIRVSDTGQGMSSDFLPHAFDSFRQEQDTSTRLHGGLGLGLAIVKQLTELHGGTVTAFSEGLGKGSAFTLTLPASHAHETVQSETVRKPDADLLKGKRVLILENDPDCREFIRIAIRNFGGISESVSTAAEALARVRPFKPDIVIADLALPDEDGFTFLRKLRDIENRLGRNMPAIAVSALASNEIHNRALSEGFKHFLAKPVTAEDLVLVISAVLNPTSDARLKRVV